MKNRRLLPVLLSLALLGGCAGALVQPKGTVQPLPTPQGSLPPVEELEQAMEIFCVCLRLAALERLDGGKS